MSIKLVQYFVQDCIINGSRVGGVQTVSFDKSVPTTDIINWGNPNESTSIYRKKSATNFTFDKFLSNSHLSYFSGFDIRDSIGKIPLDKYELGVIIYGGTSLKVQDCLLSGINFNFTNDGIFTEQMSFSGHISEIDTSGPEDVGISRNEEGIVYKRQHFFRTFLPAEVNGYPLLRVSVSMSISHGKIPSYGKFYTYEDKYVQVPVDISCEYEIIDLGYSQSDIDILLEEIQDDITFRTIKIQTMPLTIDLGDKNKLSSITKNGGNAGSSDYSTLVFKYENINNFFNISLGSSDIIDGNLSGDSPIIDGNTLNPFTFIDGNN